jgi:hypothetical protein
MFRSRAALQEIYPQLVRYAVTTFQAIDVLRFLGMPVPASGTVPHRCRHEVVTNLSERMEGIRLKHWHNGNSIKLYDKGSVLRPETTLREPGQPISWRRATRRFERLIGTGPSIFMKWQCPRFPECPPERQSRSFVRFVLLAKHSRRHL